MVCYIKNHHHHHHHHYHHPHHYHHVPYMFQTSAIIAFHPSMSSVLLMSSMLGDSFLVMKLFRLSAYFVRCRPLLLVPQIFPYNICFSINKNRSGKRRVCAEVVCQLPPKHRLMTRIWRVGDVGRFPDVGGDTGRHARVFQVLKEEKDQDLPPASDGLASRHL